MPKFPSLVIAMLLLSTGIAPADICHAADTIRINGSGSALDMMKPLIEAYRKTSRNVRIDMAKPLGSSGSIKALLAGELDLAVIGRDLKPEETAQGAEQRKYGRTPLAIVTDRTTRVRSITTKELEEIYAGSTITWQNGDKLRLVLRPSEDSDTKILAALSPGMKNALSAAHSRPGMIIAITDPESYATIAKTPGSLGTTALNSIISGRLPLTALSLNGVTPSLKTLANGAYPLVKEYSFATTSKISPAAKKFISYIFSPQGRTIAEKAGVMVTAGPATGK